jgi:hypothetical protein
MHTIFYIAPMSCYVAIYIDSTPIFLENIPQWNRSQEAYIGYGINNEYFYHFFLNVTDKYNTQRFSYVDMYDFWQF